MRNRIRIYVLILGLPAFIYSPAAGQMGAPHPGAAQRFDGAALPAPPAAWLVPPPQPESGFTAPAELREPADQVWDEPPPIGSLIGHGILGGVLGGAAMAAVTDCLTSPLDQRCWPINLGEAIGIATGVHFGNGRRGIYALDLLASGLISAGGIMALWDSGGVGVTSQATSILLLPLGQLAVAVITERLTSR